MLHQAILGCCRSGNIHVGYVSKIIDEHLMKYEDEMSKLYTESINKPL